jgi:hypothetical protein
VRCCPEAWIRDFSSTRPRRIGRRLEVEADDVADLRAKLRIAVENLNVSTRWGCRSQERRIRGDFGEADRHPETLTATATAAHTACIALIEDLAPDATAADVTQGWLRATLRGVFRDWLRSHPEDREPYA